MVSNEPASELFDGTEIVIDGLLRLFLSRLLQIGKASLNLAGRNITDKTEPGVFNDFPRSGRHELAMSFRVVGIDERLFELSKMLKQRSLSMLFEWRQ